MPPTPVNIPEKLKIILNTPYPKPFCPSGSDSKTIALYAGVATDKDEPNICPITKCSHEDANKYIKGWITKNGVAKSKAFFSTYSVCKYTSR